MQQIEKRKIPPTGINIRLIIVITSSSLTMTLTQQHINFPLATINIVHSINNMVLFYD